MGEHRWTRSKRKYESVAGKGLDGVGGGGEGLSGGGGKGDGGVKGKKTRYVPPDGGKGERVTGSRKGIIKVGKKVQTGR